MPRARSPRLHDVPGFQVAAAASGIKSDGALDLGLILADQAVPAAAVFTQNRIAAAPVQHSRRALEATGGRARAVLANAGNANCCTGRQGRQDAAACAARVGKLADCPAEEVLLASTGIIGETLPVSRVLDGIDEVYARLPSRRRGEKRFADAIRTLDTHAKEAGTTLRLGGSTVTIAGAAKGIGMCAPNMATVLVFLLTDAAITRPTLQAVLRETVAETFNRVSVDGDTSTNDSCFLLAGGAAGNPAVSGKGSAAGRAFAAALREEVCRPLAKMLAADGEGATRYLHVRVRGARSRAEADRIARAIAESPLVKTAVAGADPNWGRILMAAGKTGCTVREDRARVIVCGHVLFADGGPVAFAPAEVSRALGAKETSIELELGVGRAEAEMHTCDLTHGYITINAEYHT